MKILTIIRRKWARGGKHGSSALLNDKGAMCCLGFYAKKLGASNQTLMTEAPHCLVESLHDSVKQATWRKRFRGLVKKKDGTYLATHLATDLMTENDSVDVPDRERESNIAKMFLKLGVRVKFV
jgi:hypothetical protein